MGDDHFVTTTRDRAEGAKPNIAFRAEPFRCRYEPLPDITTHELARIVPFLLLAHARGPATNEGEWLALGEANRHLPVIDPGDEGGPPA